MATISTSAVAVWNRALGRVGHTDRVQDVDEDTEAAGVLRDCWEDTLREVLAAREWSWAMQETTLAEVGEQTATIDYDAEASTTVFTVPYFFRSTDQLEVVHISSGGTEATLDPDDDFTVDEVAEGAAQTITLDSALTSGESLRLTVTMERQGWDFLYREPDDCVWPVAVAPPGTRLADIPKAGRQQFRRYTDDAGTGQLIACQLAAADFVLHYVALRDHVPVMPRHFVKALSCALAAEAADALRKDPSLAELWRKRYEIALDEAFSRDTNIGEDGPGPDSPGIAARG